MNKPVAHQIYRHFKGNLYQIICVAKHSETGEEMVVYQALYGDYSFYVRPIEMFMSPVDKNKYPEVTQAYRFELVNPGASKREEHAEEAVINSVDEDVYEESNIDPDIVRFWDAKNYEQRIEILDAMKYKITDEMIDMMSTVIDIEIPENSDVNRRYDSFMSALRTRRMYETSRLR